MTGNQVKFTHNKATIRMPAPTLGQHNYEVLKERLNYSDEKLSSSFVPAFCKGFYYVDIYSDY